jgi:hypothetical protein
MKLLCGCEVKKVHRLVAASAGDDKFPMLFEHALHTIDQISAIIKQHIINQSSR